ncbi:hypothetical protein FN846DRAFT_891371 [Sphaerosporella brunnea]|uniref:Uncharacterized protein n=1 Tax=Sphaerosporella brunnea TaxID=1250544 RepID=A0A5J5EUN8_9PEZI|nr:hypothetical protein FN846DRAFT_891371 [Sphaerosporella brunnea]
MAHLLNTLFDTQTKTQDWITLLAYLQEQVGPAPNLKICTEPVTYTNGLVKQACLDAAKGTPEFSDYDNCNTISTALKQHRATRGTVFLFIFHLDPAVANKKQDDESAESDSHWHTPVVCIKNGNAGIYDPSYIVKAGTQVHRLASMKLVLAFLHTMTHGKKGTYKLTGDVFVSGGGNDGSKCNEMCRLWLIDQLIAQKGRNIGNREALGSDTYWPN